MPRRRKPVFARRALARIEEKAEERARKIAQFIVDEIATNPNTPYDPRTSSDTRGQHLRDAYYVDIDNNGDALIKCRRRYWAFVEFGTEEHGSAQPHVRPAIDLARAIFR